ncbi:MAG: ABC transporter permease, partial [Clostridia bacterium]|nr:ABC transporter permease [Clostridia bacterium]
MILLMHEWKQNRVTLLVWSAALAFMLGICVLIYPQMSTQMSELSDMFANMGAFTDAFGMDQLNFGEFMGYFGVECGNTLGLGGALFAAILGISALC